MAEVIKLNIKRKSLKAIIPEDQGNDKSYDTYYEENSIKKELETKYQTGFQEGFEAAKNELEKEFSNQLLEKSGQFYNILSEFEAKLAGYENNFDKIVIEVTKQVCEKVLEREVQFQTIIENTLRESVSKVLGANDVKIKIHPEDYEYLQAVENSGYVHTNFTKVSFEPDNKIQKGGCFIETEMGNVDARLGSQLSEVIKALEHNLLAEEE